MKKKILWNVILFLTLLSISLPVSADGETAGEVYGQDTLVEDSLDIAVPIYIRNNPGLKGYILNFTYDPEFMEPVFVEQGSLFTEGNFNDDIEGSTSTEGTFKVVWNNINALAENGLLFTIHFRVNENATGVSVIKTGSDMENTYNQDYESLALSANSISVKTTRFGNPALVLPAALKVISNYAFEGINATSIYVPDTCKTIGERAFYNSKICQIRIPADCQLEGNVFEGCENVMVFGSTGSDAEEYCKSHSNCTFIAE